MPFLRPHRLFAVLALAPALSCHCSSKLQTTSACAGEANVQPNNAATCANATDCADHYKCVAPRDNGGIQCCLFEDRQCSSDADCCPGERCNATAHKCFDQFLDCSNGGNTACGNPDGTGDLVCQVWTDHYGTSNRCVFQPCDPKGGCPNGFSCFQGQCMASLPCGGTCPAGDGCVPEAASGGFCQKYACPASCAPGFIATFSDNIHIWDSCNRASESCLCAELPPLRSNDLGRFSSLAVDNSNSQVLVSLYDGEFGDLVLDAFDATGTLLKQQYLDGVPDSGTVTYGPSGPRGGISDPGPDVGRYSSIAVSGAHAYIAYYDVSNAALRMAVRQADGKSWRSFQVDGAQADVGLFTSVAVDSTGMPGVAYFQRGGKPGFDASQCPAPAPTTPTAFITALKFARATTATPQSAADFKGVTLGCLGLPAPPCYQCGAVCADPGTGPGCYNAAATCTTCSSSQTCVTVGTKATCATPYTPTQLADIPDGFGLFASLAFQGQTAYLAYQKRSGGSGALYGVSLDSGNRPSAPVLLDGSDDTGYFVSARVHPTSGQVLVSYQDWTTRALKFYAGTGFQAGTTPEIVDTGVGAPGSGVLAYVGASSTLAFAPNGDVYAAYEDTTNNDLKLAARKTTWSQLAPLRTQGAVGFFASGAFLGKQLFVSHAQLHAKKCTRSTITCPTAGDVAVDNSLLLDAYTPP